MDFCATVQICIHANWRRGLDERNDLCVLLQWQRLGRQDENNGSKHRPGASKGESEDGDLEAGEVPGPTFPKSLNDFYKGKWYNTC